MRQYDDPQQPNVKPRIAVVITAHIPYGHKKIYGAGLIDDKLESIKANLACHKHFQPGIAYDLVVVDNGTEDLDGKTYLESIGALKRENEGFSFGGWKWAWEQLKDKGYSYFLFTEDDMAPAKDGWLREILDLFLSNDAIGAVGSYVESHPNNGPVAPKIWDELGMGKRKELLCLDGCFTFTSNEILRQVEGIGGLTVFPTGKDINKAVLNELAFQSKILELGYGLESFNDGKHIVIHGGNIFRGDWYGEGPVEPIINLNARHKIPFVAEIFNPIWPK